MRFNIVHVWNSYTPKERRNMTIYIVGIMFYKLGLEFFNGSITAMAAQRFKGDDRFTKLGAANGANQAAQCIGAIITAPLVRKWPTRVVLTAAMFLFGFMTAILLVVDRVTGGQFKSKHEITPHYGSWNPDLIFGVWTLSGLGYGMIELIRRVIPAEIVGNDMGKLRRMDATVHVFYEVAGIIGAFTSSVAIEKLGNNYSFFLTPVFSAVAGIIWFFVKTFDPVYSTGSLDDFSQREGSINSIERKEPNYIVRTWEGLVDFVKSAWAGAAIVLSHRKFIWLLPCYSLALYLHRFLESILATSFAVKVLENNDLSQILVGGSNIGELLGALTVFLFSDYVYTPIPWLRLNAICLNFVWVLYYLSDSKEPGKSLGKSSAWRASASLIPISFGWASGDVSLAAYIQSEISANANLHQWPGIPLLGAIMAFLYSSYIIIYAVLSAALGKTMDKLHDEYIEMLKSQGKVVSEYIIGDFKKTGGIQYSVCCFIIIAATCIPKRSLHFNPKQLGDGNSGDVEVPDSEDDNYRHKTERPSRLGPGEIVL